MITNFYDDEFQQWAFGKSPDEKEYFTTNMQALHEWNKRHGYKLTLDENSNAKDDFPIMWDLWEQEKAMREMVQVLPMKPNFFDPEFQKWAFNLPDDFLGPIGPNIDSMELWNAIHSDLLKLHPSGELNIDIPKMWDLWIEYKDSVGYKI